MLNWIKNHIFARKELKFQKLQEKNRARFIEFYSDSRFNYLEEVYRKLKVGDKKLKDNEIIEAYNNFSNSMQSNTYAIGELEFVIISQICCYKPNLTELLLERGIMAVIYSYGNQIDSSDIIHFINHQILKEDSEPYGGLPNQEAVDWLKDLCKNKSLIQKVLDKMIDINKRELAE